MVAVAKRPSSPELRIVPSARAVIYCRVSTAQQGDDGTSLDTQETACRAHCAARGHEVVAVFREVFTGAKYRERPDLGGARDLVRAGAADRIVCYAIDRLSRNQAHLAILDEEAMDHGARLEFVTEAFEDSAVGRFIRSAKAFAAETEREKIGERTMRGKRAKIESGRPLGTGKAPYGLLWADAAKTRYVEDPATAGHVRRIFADFDQGKSLRAISRALEGDGVLPSYHDRSGATHWAISSIRQILRDDTYAGVATANRYQTVIGPSGKRIATPRPDGERVPLPHGVCPVVINSALFERVRRRLEHNKRETARRDRNPEVAILRRGFAVCGYCGRALAVKKKNGGAVYRCHPDARHFYGCPGNSDIDVQDIDGAIWSWMTDTLSNEERIAHHLDRLRQQDPTEEDLTRVDRQSQAVAKQQANVAKAVTMLDDNPEALAPLVAQLDALGKQRQAHGRDRADLLRRQTAWQAAQLRLDDIRVYCHRVAANLGPATFTEQRKRLTQLRVRVEVFRTDHSPRWIATSEIIPEAATDSNLFNAAEALHALSHITRKSYPMSTTTENGHTTITEAQIREAIAGVEEPEIGRGLVELNMVPKVAIVGRDVHLTVELATPIAPYKGRLESEIRQALTSLPGLGRVTVDWTTRVRSSGSGKTEAQPIKGVKNTIAVASGKGGVGKSTVAVNLAVSLARAGAKVGLLDADVYGPSIPLMMGTHDKPPMREGKIVPLEAHGVKLMSIGFILDPNKALIWRGPLVAQLITQFLNDVDWGDLDYLIIDLPPGTGDVQLTLVQKIPISGAIIVATPQDVALADAIKGLKMFQEVKTSILGIVENMSGFVCPNCGETHYIFRQGGAKRTADAQGAPFLGEVPLEPAVVEGGDNGVPVVISAPESVTAQAFEQIASRTALQLAKEAVQKPRKPVLMLKPLARPT